MRRVDIFGIVFGVLVLLILLLAFAAKRKFQGEQTECPYHLKSVYFAYETARSDLGHPAGLLDKYTFDSQERGTRTAAAFFQLLSSNGLALPSTLCPLDTRRVAANVQVLDNTNLSYFISTRPNSGDPNRIVAGNRNLNVSGRLVDVRTNGAIAWDPSQGLHGQRGYLLLGDGSVRLTTGVQLQELAADPSNTNNYIALP